MAVLQRGGTKVEIVIQKMRQSNNYNSVKILHAGGDIAAFMDLSSALIKRLSE